MSTPNSKQHLVFSIGKTNYAIELTKVQEIREFIQPTRMINSAPEVLGALNLRGNIIPIYDMRIMFGQSEAQFDALTVVIIVNFKTKVVGFVVDKVSDVAEVSPEDVKTNPFDGEDDIEHIKITGMISHPTEGMVALIDILEFN